MDKDKGWELCSAEKCSLGCSEPAADIETVHRNGGGVTMEDDSVDWRAQWWPFRAAANATPDDAQETGADHNCVRVLGGGSSSPPTEHQNQSLPALQHLVFKLEQRETEAKVKIE